MTHFAGSIYGLVDPRTQEIRYVGQTIQPLKTRLSKHLNKVDKTHRRAWIDSLLVAGYRPEITLLDSGSWTREELDDREIYWISHYSNLTNHAPGGRVRSQTQEDKDRHSRFMVEWHKANPEKRRRPSDYKHSEETKELIRQKALKQWSDPTHLQNKSDQMKISTKKMWDNMTDQQRKDRGHRISLGRRYTYAKRKNLTLEVIS